MSEVSLLPVLPGTISAKDKSKLSKVGIIVIECADPESIRMVRAQSELSHSEMLGAAISAIANGQYSDGDIIRKHFCESLNKILNPVGEVKPK